MVVSHDRYFVERVCDDVHALMGGGDLRHLPGGIEQYVELRRSATEEPAARGGGAPRAAPQGAVLRAARKEVARLERALDRLGARETELHEAMATSATDHARLAELQAELAAVEAEWMETAEALEGAQAYDRGA